MKTEAVSLHENRTVTLVTTIARQPVDRRYPHISFILFQRMKSGDKCERYTSLGFPCTLRYRVT